MTVTPSVPLYASTDQVAKAFLTAILNWTGNVGASLPSVDKWEGNLFVQVATIGGTPDQASPMEHPVLEVKCWARPTATSKKSPWPAAGNLATAIRRACFANRNAPFPVTLPPGYPPAFVHAAYPLTHARRIPGDDSSYACYSFDLQLHWKQVG